MFRSASPLGGSRTASPRPGNRTPRSGSLAVVDSRGAQGAGGRSLTPTNFALGPGDIGNYVIIKKMNSLYKYTRVLRE